MGQHIGEGRNPETDRPRYFSNRETSELDSSLSFSMREPSFAKEKDFCTEGEQEFIGIFNKAFDKHLSLAEFVKRMEPSRERAAQSFHGSQTSIEAEK